MACQQASQSLQPFLVGPSSDEEWHCSLLGTIRATRGVLVRLFQTLTTETKVAGAAASHLTRRGFRGRWTAPRTDPVRGGGRGEGREERGLIESSLSERFRFLYGLLIETIGWEWWGFHHKVLLVRLDGCLVGSDRFDVWRPREDRLPPFLWDSETREEVRGRETREDLVGNVNEVGIQRRDEVHSCLWLPFRGEEGEGE